MKKLFLKIIYIVFAEAENCTYEEMVLIAITIFNRIFYGETFYHMNSIEKDYEGFDPLKRPVVIKDEVQRDILLEKCFEAVTEAFNIVSGKDKKQFKNVLFYKISNELDLKYFVTERIEKPEGFFMSYKGKFKHNFFKLIRPRTPEEIRKWQERSDEK